MDPVALSEHQLIGVRYLIDLVDSDIVISNASHWVFKNTGLKNGSKLIGLLGYEVDGAIENEPPGIQILATSPAIRGTNTDERHPPVPAMADMGLRQEPPGIYWPEPIDSRRRQG